MSILVECGGCGEQYSTPDDWAGRRAKCRGCGRTMRIPAPRSEVQPGDLTTDLLDEEFGLGETIADPVAGGFPGSSAPGVPGDTFSRDQPRAFRRPSGGRGPSGLLRNYYLLTAVGLVACSFVLVGMLVLLSLLPKGNAPSGLADREEPYETESVSLPGFGERGTRRALTPGVDVEDVSLTVSRDGPGHCNRLQIYTPPGTHGDHSLPCVLIATAGTNLISGIGLGDGADHPERVPYVLAGYAVVAFELDGEYSSEEPNDAEMRRGFQEFAAAQAGLVNARNALEYVLAKMPEVDPERIYAAGHSSAATLAVLFAEHEPRLRACVAYAPVNDLAAHFGEDAAMLRRFLPGAEEFFVKSSPITHAANLECPLFLFHARDDSVVPVAGSIAFAETLKGLGKDVTLQVVSSGGHYDPMIEEGIPNAIEWLRAHGGAGSAKPARTAGTGDESVERSDLPSGEGRRTQVPASEAKLDRLLATLQSGETKNTAPIAGLSQLAKMEPIEARREEVAGLIDPYLNDSNQLARSAALLAVAVWGTERNIPALLRCSEQPSSSATHHLIGALKSIRDPRTMEALVRLVADEVWGSTAAIEVQDLGPAAEEAVIRLLEHENYEVRYRACTVLQRIGGEKSIAALQDLLRREKHAWSRAGADVALRKLRERRNSGEF